MIDATTQRNRTWLLNVENLTMVHLCRRAIETEFGERLHLTAPDLLTRIRDYAGRSHNNDLRRLARPIIRLLNTPVGDEQTLDLSHIPTLRRHATRAAQPWPRAE